MVTARLLDWAEKHNHDKVVKYFEDEWLEARHMWATAFLPSDWDDRTNNLAESHFKVRLG